jgi:MarR family transcriptional regulator, transcriptional regulator for hemolysin
MAKFVLAKKASEPRTLVEELGMLISKTRRLVWMHATRRLEASGDSMLSWQVLAHLVRVGKSTQTEVALALAQHPAGVSRLVEELDRQGYVLRRRDPRDRRRVHVEASARGRRRFLSILPEVVRGVDQALETLSDQDRRVLRDLLRRVVSQDAECKMLLFSGGR